MAENLLKALEQLAGSAEFYLKVSSAIPEDLTLFEHLTTQVKELSRNKQELELLTGDLENLQQHIEEREEIISMYCTCHAAEKSHTRRRSSDSKTLPLKQTNAW